MFLFLVLFKFKLDTALGTMCHIECNHRAAFRTVIYFFIVVRFFRTLLRSVIIFHELDGIFNNRIDAVEIAFRQSFYVL